MSKWLVYLFIKQDLYKSDMIRILYELIGLVSDMILIISEINEENISVDLFNFNLFERMIIMKAFVHELDKQHVKDMQEPKAREGEVVVLLKVAGLNRRDLNIKTRRGEVEEALILGSDGSGIVDSISEGVSDFSVGDDVIINPSLRWDKNSDAPPEEFDILGMPDHGTFAEKIAISAAQLERKPEYLSFEEAGVTALSGLTGYRALFTKGGIQTGETLFIPGASSGVATFIIQFAKEAGARVIVTSRSKEKREQALKIGADLALDTNDNWEEQLKNETIDLVIDSVGRATFNRSLKVLKQGGKIVVFGATTEDTVELNLREFFYGQYRMFGSTMGSREELKDMLEFMSKYEIRPIIDQVFSLNDIQTAFNHLDKNEQFGKIAIKINE